VETISTPVPTIDGDEKRFGEYPCGSDRGEVRPRPAPANTSCSHYHKPRVQAWRLVRLTVRPETQNWSDRTSTKRR
jgi:hypothetical protein